MTAAAAQLIAEVQTLGGVLSVAGERLRIESDKALPDELLSRLKAAKPEIVSAIRRGARWDARDWRAFYDERAAIAEHDGALSRTEAEATALRHCVVRWLMFNPPADRGDNACCCCGEYAGPDALVILAGDGSLRRVVHDRCYGPMRAARQAEAAAAIEAALIQAERNDRE